MSITPHPLFNIDDDGVIGTHAASEDQQPILKRGRGVSTLLAHLKRCKISSINSTWQRRPDEGLWQFGDV